MEQALSPNVQNDLNWLESELSSNESGGRYLVGSDLTAADILMGFSIEFILMRRLGTDGGSWPKVQTWLSGITNRDAYKLAVEKTGYSL